jgi:type VI secretion system secreted protein VgrG
MTNQIIWSFIESKEGFNNKAYVPLDNQGNVAGNSGITIGSGVDLGAIGEEGLQKLNLSDDLFQKLNKYTPYKKDDAVEFLSRNPLTLYKNECIELQEAVESQAADTLEAEFNNDSDTLFANLTPTQQTIIMSVAFQYGNLSQRTPKFWKYATEGCWPCVVNVLRNFGDAYGTRRNSEADILENSLK